MAAPARLLPLGKQHQSDQGLRVTDLSAGDELGDAIQRHPDDAETLFLGLHVLRRRPEAALLTLRRVVTGASVVKGIRGDAEDAVQRLLKEVQDGRS
jgi:hypothetical protein